MTDLLEVIQTVLAKQVRMVEVNTFFEILAGQDFAAVTVFSVEDGYLLRAETSNHDRVVFLSTARDQSNPRVFKSIDAIHSLLSKRFKFYSAVVVQHTDICASNFDVYISELSKIHSERVEVLKSLKRI